MEVARVFEQHLMRSSCLPFLVGVEVARVFEQRLIVASSRSAARDPTKHRMWGPSSKTPQNDIVFLILLHGSSFLLRRFCAALRMTEANGAARAAHATAPPAERATLRGVVDELD